MTLSFGSALLMIALTGCGLSFTETLRAPEGGGHGGGETHAARRAANHLSSLGTNLTGIADWTREFAFVDVFKGSRAWVSGNTATGAWDDARTFNLDEKGWITSLKPSQVAHTILFTDFPNPLPDFLQGEWTLLYDGEGTLAHHGGPTVVSSEPGKQIVQVDAPDTMWILNLTTTNPSGYLKNLRALPPGGSCAGDSAQFCKRDSACTDGTRCVPFSETYQTKMFHPLFLAQTQRYHSLRFMDFMSVNHSEQSAWANRPKPTDARWSTKGVPVEIMVALANELQAHPWFSMPHKADDNYVREFAKVVRERLNEPLQIYIEHSNEVWNNMFGQATYARERGLALGLGGGDGFRAQILYHARRSVEIFDLWESELGGTSRLVRVLGSFSVLPWVTEQMLLHTPGALTKTDALAIAPYFGGEMGNPNDTDANVLRSMSVDAFLHKLKTESVPKVLNDIKAHNDSLVALNPEIDLIAYEGGQHLAGLLGIENDVEINALFDAANRSPEMGKIYTTYLDGWKARGGKLFMQFVNCSGYSKWGRWGALEYQGQDPATAPKFLSLMDFIVANPIWW